MKNIILITGISLLLTLSVSNSYPQTAPDFTATDIHGQTWHLYELLDDGKYVLLDFFAYG